MEQHSSIRRILRPSLFSAAVFTCALASFAQSQALMLSSNSGGGERQPIVTDEGEVIFAAMRGSSRELFVVPVDGGTTTQLTQARDVRLGYGTFDSWSSFSADASGKKIAFWDTSGVQVLDRGTQTVTTLSTANSHAYPRIDGKGENVVYQAIVNGSFEVFYRKLSANAPIQITTQSGEGRRFPDLLGGYVIYQKPAQGAQEVFVFDLGTNTEKQLTSQSGLGNRYGQLTADGKSVVYERTIAGKTREAYIIDLATAQPRALTQLATNGERLGTPTRDGYVFAQAWKRKLGVVRIDITRKDADLPVTAGGAGGLRRPKADPHGHVVVYQDIDPATGSLEVWRYRLCPSLATSDYGASGTPSVGTIGSAFADWYRCELTLGRRTTVPTSRVAVLILGAQQLNLSLGSVAPGNSLYTDTLVLLPTLVTASGDMAQTIPLPAAATATLFTQWALIDARANTLGVVTSAATRVDLR